MDEYWIWLTLIPQIGVNTANKLIRYYKDPVRIYEAEKQDLKQSGILTEKQMNQMLLNHSLENACRILEECETKNIGRLLLTDSRYPLKAAELHDAPILLYTRGNLHAIDQSIAIVGSRRCTQEEKERAAEISREFTSKGYTIISGMAKGIDSYAHTACIQNGGYTLAFLGNGVDICYPAEHKLLMERIMENGAVISEYPPGTRATKYTFPARNRLISAWSDKVAVISSAHRSGAYITADYAEKYGRELCYIL